jgi:S1-C subfamily serine protease
VLDAEIFRLSSSKETDVALLKIQVPDLKPLPLARGELEEANPGDPVAIIGYPLGLDPLRRSNEHTIEPALSPGVVNRVGRESIQVTLRAFRGNSGGPVLTSNGDVIGILTANMGDGSIALCTPIGAVIELLK